MVSDQRVVVRLSPETVGVLRALVDKGEFRSLTDAVRSVISDYAEERLAQGIEPAPEHGDDALYIGDLTIDGTTLDGAVRDAVGRYVRERSCGE